MVFQVADKVVPSGCCGIPGCCYDATRVVAWLLLGGCHGVAVFPGVVRVLLNCCLGVAT